MVRQPRNAKEREGACPAAGAQDLEGLVRVQNQDLLLHKLTLAGTRLHSPLPPGHIFQPHLSPLDARALTRVSRAGGAQYARTQTFFWCPEPSSCNNDVFLSAQKQSSNFPQRWNCSARCHV